jgi:excisionase family DNA binding protein
VTVTNQQAEQQGNGRGLLTLIETADLLRISPHTVRALVRRGRLRPIRICRRLLFSQQEIARLIAEAE